MLDELTRLLCIACTSMDNDDTYMDEALATWWQEHQDKEWRSEQVAERRISKESLLRQARKEALRQQALALLTAEQMEALGVKP